MQHAQLATAIREAAEKVMDLSNQLPDEDEDFHNKVRALGDAYTLLRVLANVTDGKPLLWAMGSPGDWGRSTKLGQALVAAIQDQAAATAAA